jgi:hypothetical protein
MKLYHILITNNLEYDDYDDICKLAVAHNMLEAEIKAKIFMEENYSMDSYNLPSFFVDEINEVDGFNIEVTRNGLR